MENRDAPLLDEFPRVPINIALAMDAWTNRHLKTRENLTMLRYLLREAFLNDTWWQHLGPKILARQQENKDSARHLNARCGDGSTARRTFIRANREMRSDLVQILREHFLSTDVNNAFHRK